MKEHLKKVQIYVALTLLLAAVSCRSTDTTELRPVAQVSPSVSQAPAAPAPASAPTAAPTPVDASSSGATRMLVAPGATGQITRSIDDNHNLVLEVQLEHLPPPTDLDPALTTYVVWIRPLSSGVYQNAGRLIIDSNRKGELTTTTAHNDVEVVVTAEASATPREPSRFTVLQGTASRR